MQPTSHSCLWSNASVISGHMPFCFGLAKINEKAGCGACMIPKKRLCRQ